MSKSSTWLLESRRDVYSLAGEDGVIERILETLPPGDRWCVEFGAWDGLVTTNTRHLIESMGFSAVLIEADRKKFGSLQHNYSGHERVITLNRTVGFGDDDNLDQILRGTPVPPGFDLLSIDIDGNDFHVWKAVSRYRPKVVVIEFNPTIPTHIHFVQAADPTVNQGASLSSLVELGKQKSYELVAVLPWNAFFVRSEYYPLFEMESNDPETLRTDLGAISYIFSGYDGRVFLRGACRLPWHGIALRESSFQALPRWLRRFPDRYTALQRAMLWLYPLLTNSEERKRRLWKRISLLTRRGPRL